MPLSVSENTLYDLEWDRVVDALAGHAATLNGRARCLALPFYESVSEAAAEIERVAEYRRLAEMSDPPSLAGISSEVAGFVVKTQKHGVLEIGELLMVADTIKAGNRILKRMSGDADSSPKLSELCEGITPLHQSVSAIEHAVDRRREELKDSASGELGPLRRQVRNLHAKIKRKLDDLLGSQTVKALLRDNYFTIRDDRYVLPVKTAEKAGLKGIVHGSSGTGQTIYVEPKEMVSINNDLIMAEMAVVREELRILSNLSRLVAEEGQALLANLEILTELDVVQAKARLSEMLDCRAPKMLEQSRFFLKKASHPLLLMKDVETIANDLYLGDDFKALIISGANTGGKTVALKTMGLSVLMAWSGMHIPAAEGSTVGRFDSLFTVMGDEQSLADDLSTFSANIIKLNEVIKGCGERSLILLDEIVVGTDPRQGAALAQAIVESMADSGARMVITTHYERLKRLAYARDDFANAAVGLGEESLKPNYHVHIGVPGASAAFNIAQELGVIDHVVQRARNLMEGGDDELDGMVARLQEEITKQKEEVRRLEKAKEDLELVRATYERRLRLLESRERQEIVIRRKEVIEEIAEAREQVREIIRTLQKGGTMSEATRAMEELKRREEEAEEAVSAQEKKPKVEQVGSKDDGRKALTADALRPDMEVYIANLNQKGVVVQGADKRGMALVAVGRLKMRIPVERLKALNAGERGEVKKKGGNLKEALLSGSDGHESNQTISCDVRGERVEEAMMMVESFLDRAMQRNAPFVYIIHGHGTGRLKSVLREYFKTSPYVQKFRPGERGEGQDGVTVVVMKK